MRNYDDGLGRFTSVDADWELYRDLTPYNYAENNPLVLKDPSGYGPGDRDDYQDKNLPMRHIGGGSGGPRTAPSVGYNSTAKPSAPKAPKSQTSSGSKRGSGGNSGVGGGTTPSDNQAVSMSSERYPMQQAKGADVTPKTSRSGKYSEPKLPDKEIVNENGVKVEHYYKSGDHPPAHMHVRGNGNSTRIGENGKPLKGNPELSTAQQKVVEANRAQIRKAGKQISKYQEYQENRKSE